MANAYYQSGAQRASLVQSLFNRIATRYDWINDWQSFGLHRRWKARLVAIAEVSSGHHALDVCCGTGDVALALANRGADTIGCDFSEAMLEVARARIREKTNSDLVPRFETADALHLPYRTGKFDAVTMAYGLRNLADFERGIREMERVLKPGGRAVILDCSHPPNRLWRWCHRRYLQLVVPIFGWVFCGDRAAYAYLLESLDHFPGPRELETLFRRCGLLETRIETFLGGVMVIVVGIKREP